MKLSLLIASFLVFQPVLALETALGAPGVFSDAALDIYFYYPEEMTSISEADPPQPVQPSTDAHPKPGNEDYNATQACLKTLLDVDLPADGAGTGPATLGALSSSTAGTERIQASIRLFEVNMDCECAALRKKRDAAMRGIAETITHVNGMQALGKPLWYDLGKQKIHMNTAIGSVHPGQGPVLMADMVTEYKAHVLMWVLQSNDAVTFNTITKSTVQFGPAPPLPLFPAKVGPDGPGLPLKILPR